MGHKDPISFCRLSFCFDHPKMKYDAQTIARSLWLSSLSRRSHTCGKFLNITLRLAELHCCFKRKAQTFFGPGKSYQRHFARALEDSLQWEQFKLSKFWKEEENKKNILRNGLFPQRNILPRRKARAMTLCILEHFHDKPRTSCLLLLI